MFKEPNNLKGLGQFFWSLGNGLTFICIVIITPTFILLFITYAIYLYSKVYDLKADFDKVKIESTDILDNVGIKVEPTLQWRSRSGSYYLYLQSYHLNPDQLESVKKYIIQNYEIAQTYFGGCISKTIETKWLYPKISRHYVETLSSNKAMHSFLVYGSDEGLHEIEQICSSKKYILANIKANDPKIDQIQLRFDQQYQMIIINFTFNNRH